MTQNLRPTAIRGTDGLKKRAAESRAEKIRKLVIATMLLKNCALELTFDLADCHNA